MTLTGPLTEHARSVRLAFTTIASFFDSRASAHTGDADAVPWLDQCGQFHVWAADTGACHILQPSLDYKLRDDTQVREEILVLLRNLEEELGTARQILSSKNNSTEEDAQDTFVDDNKPRTQRICNSVAATIQRLFQMALLAKQPGQADFLRSQEFCNVKDSTIRIHSDLVKEFPKMSFKLASRMAGALGRQHSYLAYRAHQSNQARKPQMRDIGVQRRGYVRWTDPTNPKTSYIAHQTLVSGGIMPRRPFAGEKRSVFECPYCFCIIKAGNESLWTKHLFDDLKPFMCIAENCSSSTISFTSKHQWRSHLQSSHASEGFGLDRLGNRDCPFCDCKSWTTNDQDSWVHHVGQHLKEITLSAVLDQDSIFRGYPVDEICDSNEDDSSDGEDDTSYQER